ncbi:MAG: LytTR family DNA-binding domain-containing protein [Pseudomonadota bacterium]
MFKRREIRSETTLWIIAFVCLGVAYLIQFQVVRDESVLRSVRTALVNVVPIVLIGISVRLFVRRYLISRPVIEQVAVHFLLAIIFAHLWYLLILVAAGFRPNWLASGIRLSPFYESATLWQLLQGVVIYAAMQGLIYARWLQEQLQATQSALAEALQKKPDASQPERDSVFVKVDGEFKKVDLTDLIHLEADGDQVRLHTKLGTFSCNKSLSDYALKLEDSGYIRIHRSHLVRANAILSAEPTGDGRLSIHLASGASIVASRNGARAFRQYTK